jgi:RNA polymerase sigma-70 factor (ECF subfamily)
MQRSHSCLAKLRDAPLAAATHHPPTLAAGLPPDAEHPETDLELLRRIGGGDNHAWGCFYTRWGARLQRSAQRVLHDPHEADDAVSDAMIQIRARAMRGELPGRSDDVEKWIFARVRTCAMRLRERRDVAVEALDWLAASEEEPGADDGTASDALLVLLRRAVTRLPPAARRVVRLRFIDGRSFGEIAAIERCGETGARGRVERGVRELVAILFAAKRAATPEQLDPAERAHVQDVAAKIRAKTPEMTAPDLIHELCRRTGIVIESRACAVALLGRTLPRRSP